MIEKHLSIKDDLIFYMTASSERCSYKPLELMWDLTLEQFLDEREFIETQEAMKIAVSKDMDQQKARG